MIDKKNLYNIGTFGRPHGVKGEITLFTNCELPDFDKDSYIVCEMDGIPVPFFIDSFRTKSVHSVLVKFENIDSEQNVKIFTGKTAYIDVYTMKEVEKSQEEPAFIGFQVIDENLSFEGVVTDMDDSTENVLLKVDSGGKEFIIPFAFFLFVNTSEKAIHIKLPEGFLDI
ncbi:MAG: 16S rRNA processing protein RimM [Tannerella sp.]|jgi:16S rRNA processing protein RimM|nr:16S rRNA processing protein RimM [Tannerella sp.]